jgi:hypothetical protein
MKHTVLLALLGIGVCWLILTLSFVRNYHPTKRINGLADSTICAIDTNEAYFVFWEKVFLTRDQMQESYYREHLAVIIPPTVI